MFEKLIVIFSEIQSFPYTEQQKQPILDATDSLRVHVFINNYIVFTFQYRFEHLFKLFSISSSNFFTTLTPNPQNCCSFSQRRSKVFEQEILSSVLHIAYCVNFRTTHFADTYVPTYIRNLPTYILNKSYCFRSFQRIVLSNNGPSPAFFLFIFCLFERTSKFSQ